MQVWSLHASKDGKTCRREFINLANGRDDPSGGARSPPAWMLVFWPLISLTWEKVKTYTCIKTLVRFDVGIVRCQYTHFAWVSRHVYFDEGYLGNHHYLISPPMSLGLNTSKSTTKASDSTSSMSSLHKNIAGIICMFDTSSGP